MDTIQTMPTGVSAETLQSFLHIAAGNFTVADKHDLPQITEVKGRCVTVHVLGGPIPAWYDLADLLLGGCNKPAEEFNVNRNFITARLKTAAQVAADDLAYDIDEAHGELKSYGLFLDAADAEPTAKAAKAPKKKAGKKIPEGAATTVMKTIEKHMPVGAIDTDELILLTKKVMTPRVDAEGKDRTKKYIKAAVDKLVELEFLYVHGDDQDQVSLTAIVVEGDDA